MILYQLKPTLELILETNYLQEMNSYIHNNISAGHRSSWIEEHLRLKQRHFILVINEDKSLARVYIIVNIKGISIEIEPGDRDPSIKVLDDHIITKISDYLPRPKITDLTNRDLPPTFRLI